MTPRQTSDIPKDADQRRHVAILYSDLCGSTRLGAAVDPEDLAHVVRAVKALATETVAGFDGLVTQFHGDGVLALFGYPDAREDDIQRAIEAALKLHNGIRRLDLAEHLPRNFPLRLHSGIDAGLVLIHQGDFLDGALELVGDPVNTAAGLCKAAAEDEIVVSAATLGGIQPYFVASQLEPLLLKGKSNPVAAYRVLQRSEVQTRFEASKRRGLTAFCGRASELGRLRDHLQRAREGHPQVVQIVGDPGLGKTRLVDEFVREAVAAGCAVQRGHCERRGGIAPLHPFLQMLRSDFDLALPATAAEVERRVGERLEKLDRRLSDHAEAFLQTLAPTVGAAGSAKSRPAMEQPLTDWLLATAEQRPLVLVVDDWQWADDASRKVLGRLLRQAQEASLLVIVAARDVDPDTAVALPSDLIQLQPISESDTERMMRTLLPDQLDLGVLAKLHRKSGGNPLFVEELCQSYLDWSRLEEEPSAGGVVPATLQGLIETRVQRLAPELAELVQTAAVIGTVIPCWLLERLTGLGENDERIRQLAAGDLIYAGDIKGTLQFKHGITRDTIYAAVGLKRRRALHNRIAEILEQLGEQAEPGVPGGLEEHFESLAYHYAGGASHRKALQYAELAGDKALASSSLDRARQQYEAAMHAIDQLPPTPELRRRWISISERWALPCVYGPQTDQLATLQRTVNYAIELDDLDGLAHAYYWQGYISYVLGDQPASIAFYDRALLTAQEAGNNRLTVQIIATLGQSHAAASNYSEALPFLEKAIDEKRRHPTRSRIRVGTSYALSAKSLVLGDMGDFTAAHACSEEAYANVRGQGHEIESSILNNHGTVCLWQGRWEEAIDLAGRSRTIAEHVTAPYLYACAAAINAYGRWMQSADGDAIDTLKRTIAWVEDKGMYLYSSFFYAWITDALVARGELQEACGYGARGLARARQQDRVGEAMVCRALAMAAMRDDGLGLDAPERYLAMARRSAEDRHSPHELAITQLFEAGLADRRKQPDRAARLRAEARATFDRLEMPWHLARSEPETAPA